MRKIIFTAVFCLAVCVQYVHAQGKRYCVAFYNVENLFDTIHSPGVFDEEFLPGAAKGWNSQKYWKKISNLEQVFYGIASSAGDFPTIIGVSEIENRNVLEDIVATEKLQPANYQIVHYDSPDARGVDVALFYRPDQFRYEGSFPIPVHMPSQPNFKTRDILSVWGTIEGERFCFFVGHWPSRLGGQQASEPKRCLVAQIIRNATDSILRENPETKIVIMGDLNDDPTDKSIAEVLDAKCNSESLSDGDLYNPFCEMFKKGYGTLAYQDKWNLFDNIIVSSSLVDGQGGTLHLTKGKKSKFYGNIFDRPLLRQQSGQYKNYPLRTFVGNEFQGGYSDHFPVFIYISR